MAQTMTMDQPALLLRPREAAQALGVSERTLWSLTAPRGPIRSVRIGPGKKPLVRYSVSDLEAFIAARASGA